MTDPQPAVSPPASITGRPAFCEYPLGAGVTTLRVLADALTTAVLTSVVAFFLGILPLVGVIDERALGREHHEALDDWSRAWVGITVGLGFCVLGVFAVAFTTAADVAARARLRREAEQPDAGERIPIFQQRRLLSADVWGPARMAGGGVAVFAGFLAVLFVGMTLYLLSKHSNDIGTAVIATAALAALTAASLAVYLWARKRPNWKSKATAQWSEQAAKIARDVAKAERRGQGRGVASVGDRVRGLLSGPLAKTLGWLAGAWGLAGFVMVFIRKPGRNAAELHYSAPVEDGIDVVWRVLVVSGLALLVLGAAAWLVVLALDLVRLVGLTTRARRGAGTPWPSKDALNRALAVPGATGMLGRSLIALATLVGAGALAMVFSDRGPVEARTWALTLAGLAAVLGLACTAAGYSVQRRWRGRVRVTWAVPDALVAKSGKRAERRESSSGINAADLL